jgi:hypothetical protein
MVAGFLFGCAAWANSLHFSEQTLITERGRIGSLITGCTLFTTPISIVIIRFHPIPLYILFSLLTFLTVRNTTASTSRPTISKMSASSAFNLNAQAFILYLVPWLLLSFNNATFMHVVSTQLHTQFFTLQSIAFTLQYLSAGIGTIICGLLIDWIGRRNMAIISFTILGIIACLAGLIPTPTFYILFNIISGFGWGSLLVLFLLIIWSEVNPPQFSGLKYGFGLSMYHFAQTASTFFFPTTLAITEAVLINASLMFISLIFLVNAKNLIPPDVKERMYYNLYLKQAKKML